MILSRPSLSIFTYIPNYTLSYLCIALCVKVDILLTAIFKSGQSDVTMFIFMF